MPSMCAILPCDACELISCVQVMNFAQYALDYVVRDEVERVKGYLTEVLCRAW